MSTRCSRNPKQRSSIRRSRRHHTSRKIQKMKYSSCHANPTTRMTISSFKRKMRLRRQYSRRARRLMPKRSTTKITQILVKSSKCSMTNRNPKKKPNPSNRWPTISDQKQRRRPMPTWFPMMSSQSMKNAHKWRLKNIQPETSRHKRTSNAGAQMPGPKASRSTSTWRHKPM